MLPEVLATYPLIDHWRAAGYQYYVVPKAMLRHGKQFGLGIDEVMLYSILRDRARLSYRNNWIDKDGHVYIVYTRSSAADYIGWSKRKTITVFGNLVDAGLLTEREQRSQHNMMKPKRLYVRQWAEPTFLHSAEELKNGGFSYFTEKNIFADSGEYYIIPKVFFEDEALKGLSLRAIFLYMIILDQMHLSINYGKVDKDGKVWCSVDNDQISLDLGCSPRSLTSAYSELDASNLLVRARSGYGAGMKLYLRDYMPAPNTTSSLPETPAAEGETKPAPPVPQDSPHIPATSAPRTDNSCTTVPQSLHYVHAEDAPGDAQDLHPSKLFSHPSLPNPISDNIAADKPAASWPVMGGGNNISLTEAYAQVQNQVSYQALCDDIRICVPEELQGDYYELLDMGVQLMANDLSFPGVYIRLGNTTVPKEEVMQSILPIDRYILFTLLGKLQQRIEIIRKSPLYIHRAILNAVMDHGAAAYFAKMEITRARIEQGL